VVARASVLTVCGNDESSIVIRGIGVIGEDIMAMRCLVDVSVLCSVTDPACQSNGQLYSTSRGALRIPLKLTFKLSIKLPSNHPL
jgi:hypothetical protein